MTASIQGVQLGPAFDVYYALTELAAIYGSDEYPALMGLATAVEEDSQDKQWFRDARREAKQVLKDARIEGSTKQLLEALARG